MLILVVDDDPLLRQLLCACLSSMTNAQVVDAGGSAAALEAVQTAPFPQVILLDIHLPSAAEGFGLLQSLAGLPSLRETKIICISGNSDAEIQARARRLGACAFLPKPIQPAAIVDEVMRIYTAQ